MPSKGGSREPAAPRLPGWADRRRQDRGRAAPGGAPAGRDHLRRFASALPGHGHWDGQAVARQVRQRLEAIARDDGPDALHVRLRQADPSSAERIDARNVRRVVRALEILEVTGQPASMLRRPQPPPYRVLRLGLTAPREVLYARIDTRIDRMLELGGVDEGRRLIDEDFDTKLPSFSAIGYPQIVEVVRGRRSLEAAPTEIRRRTRGWVRHQASWFKPSDRAILWFEAGAG